MAVSGWVPTLNHPDAAGIETPEDNVVVQCSVLSDNELQLLDQVYESIIPQYKHLASQYRQALQRATNTRKKSLFPSRSEWQLLQYPLGTIEWELLIGPSHSITPAKRVVIDNPPQT